MATIILNGSLVTGLLLSIAAAVLLADDSPTSAPARQRDDLAVMTFNIRYQNDHDGPNGWAFRKALVIQTIRDFNPDVLGSQEVKADQLAFLEEQLSADYIVLAGKPASAMPTGEHQAIFVRKCRFELIERGQFWLSETPDKPGSRGWDANLPRSVNWARLKDLQRGGATILFLNTHWDHLGEQARQESGKLVRRWIAENANGSSVMLTGDFNADADSQAYQNLFAKPASGGELVDAYRTVRVEAKLPEEMSFHDFTGKPKSGRIDWIASTRDLVAIASDNDRRHEKDLYPSDHFPVWAILRPSAKQP